MYTKATFVGEPITESFLCLGSGSKIRRKCEKAEYRWILVIHSWNVKWLPFFKRQPWWFAHFLRPITGSITRRRRKKKIVSEDQSGKRKSLIREGLFFMTGITLNWKLCLCKISPVHAIQQKFQVKFQLAICVSYLFPSFQLPNWRYRIKCEGTPLCNFLLIIQREFPRSCLSIKTKRKFYK